MGHRMGATSHVAKSESQREPCRPNLTLSLSILKQNPHQVDSGTSSDGQSSGNQVVGDRHWCQGCPVDRDIELVMVVLHRNPG